MPEVNFLLFPHTEAADTTAIQRFSSSVAQRATRRQQFLCSGDSSFKAVARTSVPLRVRSPRVSKSRQVPGHCSTLRTSGFPTQALDVCQFLAVTYGIMLFSNTPGLGLYPVRAN